MTNEKELNEKKLSKNLNFLRNAVGLTINQLAEITETDPITIFQIEDNFSVFDLKDYAIMMTDIANYFSIKLDDFFYSDIEEEKLISADWIQKLIDEKNTGKMASRKEFNKSLLLEEITELTDNCSEEDTCRNLLKLIQKSTRMKNRYDRLRDAGKIDRIDFLEG